MPPFDIDSAIDGLKTYLSGTFNLTPRSTPVLLALDTVLAERLARDLRSRFDHVATRDLMALVSALKAPQSPPVPVPAQSPSRPPDALPMSLGGVPVVVSDCLPPGVDMMLVSEPVSEQLRASVPKFSDPKISEPPTGVAESLAVCAENAVASQSEPLKSEHVLDCTSQPDVTEVPEKKWNLDNLAQALDDLPSRPEQHALDADKYLRPGHASLADVPTAPVESFADLSADDSAPIGDLVKTKRKPRGRK